MITTDVTAFRRLYLHNLALEDQDGVPMSNDDLLSFIRSAAADFQREFGVRLQPTIVRMGTKRLSSEPVTRATAPSGTTPEELEALLPLEEYDAITYDPRSFEGSRHGRVQLPLGPVKEVYGVALDLPGRRMTELPLEAVQVTRKRKYIQIYWKQGFPYAPVFAMTGIGFMSLDSGRSIPGAWHVAYRCGYTPEDFAGADSDVFEAVLKMAAIRAMTIGSADKNFAVGITGRTVTVDGLSQTTQLAANANQLKYAALIKTFQDDLNDFTKVFAFRKSGIKMAVL